EQLTLRELRRRFPSLPEFKIPCFGVSRLPLGGESGDLATIDFSVRPPRVRINDIELSLADFAAIGGAGISRGQGVPYWVLDLSPVGPGNGRDESEPARSHRLPRARSGGVRTGRSDAGDGRQGRSGAPLGRCHRAPALRPARTSRGDPPCRLSS